LIQRDDILSMEFLKKTEFTGCHQGMRYRLRKAVREGEGTFLEAVIYHEPYSFEATAEDMKTCREFSFTQEGFDEAVAWLNQEYIGQKERWSAKGNRG